jgi:BASS family bile acid:Na+ symporter
MMPLLALGLGKAFGLPTEIIAGMVLVGSINGGQASNLCTYIAKVRARVCLFLSMMALPLTVRLSVIFLLFLFRFFAHRDRVFTFL